jgi:peptidoglycan/LPS O-acetylase OafA/YrhL
MRVFPRVRMTITGARRDRFVILDCLRGVFALVVVLGHLGLPPLFGPIDQVDPFWRGLARLFQTVAFGPPAVIGFFVISGFCIHYPFADDAARLPVLRFYARRYLRVSVPILAAVIILMLVQPGVVLLGDTSILWRSTLWSLLCEEIYYGLYPLLRAARHRIGMDRLVVLSFTASLVIIGATFPAVEWYELGVLGTSLALLPVWLLGAKLAEDVSRSRLREVGGGEIALWRMAAWIVMWISLLLHFHGGFHQTASGPVVGIFAYFWLKAEVANKNISKMVQVIATVGTWSYSLYLVHPLIIAVFSRFDLRGTQSMSIWILLMALIMTCSYLFYVLIEAPSHALARRISLRPSNGRKLTERSRPQGAVSCDEQRLFRIRKGSLAVCICITVILTAGYQSYRTQVQFRQIVRMIGFLSKQWQAAPTLLLVGDSRVEALSCPNQLGSWRALNMGIAGLTASELRTKLANWIWPVEHFDRSVVWIGVNDVLHRNRTSVQVSDDLRRVIDLLVRHSDRVAVVAPIPVLDHEDSGVVHKSNQDLVSAQRSLMASFSANDESSSIKQLMVLPMDEKPAHPEIYADPLHLNAAGNGIVCARLASWLAES